jgi:hypothetical protein
MHPTIWSLTSLVGSFRPFGWSKVIQMDESSRIEKILFDLHLTLMISTNYPRPIMANARVTSVCNDTTNLRLRVTQCTRSEVNYSFEPGWPCTQKNQSYAEPQHWQWRVRNQGQPWEISMDHRHSLFFKSQKRVFSLGFEKSHSSCCAAGIEG